MRISAYVCRSQLIVVLPVTEWLARLDLCPDCYVDLVDNFQVQRLEHSRLFERAHYGLRCMLQAGARDELSQPPGPVIVMCRRKFIVRPATKHSEMLILALLWNQRGLLEFDTLPFERRSSRASKEEERRRLNLHLLRHQRRKPPAKHQRDCHLLKQIRCNVDDGHIGPSGSCSTCSTARLVAPHHHRHREGCTPLNGRRA